MLQRPPTVRREACNINGGRSSHEVKMDVLQKISSGACSDRSNYRKWGLLCTFLVTAGVVLIVLCQTESRNALALENRKAIKNFEDLRVLDSDEERTTEKFPFVDTVDAFRRWDRAQAGCSRFREKYDGFLRNVSRPSTLQDPASVSCELLKLKHVSIRVKSWTWIPDSLDNLYSCRCGLTCIWTKSSVLADNPDALFYEWNKPPMEVRDGYKAPLLSEGAHLLFSSRHDVLKLMNVAFLLQQRQQGDPLRIYIDLEPERQSAPSQDIFVSYHGSSDVQSTYAGALFHNTRSYYVSPLKNKDVLVYWSSSRCLPERQQIASSFLPLISHHSFGKCLNNVGGGDAALTMYPKCRQPGQDSNWNQHLHCAMSHYKFVLAIENTRTESYVTEKLFYALDAGAVPIYFGAPNVLDLVPPHSIIDGSKFSNMESLASYVTELAENPVRYAEYHAWRRCGVMEDASREWVWQIMSKNGFKLCLGWVAREATVSCHVQKQQPDSSELARLVKSCGNTKDLSKGRLVHRQIIEGGHWQSTYLCNVLVDMYGKCGSLEEARAVFDGMQEPNAYTWSIMVGAYAQNGYLQESKSMLERMPQHNVVSGTSVLSAYAGHRHLQEARTLFDKMPSRDMVAWNAMVQGYAQNGHPEQARCMFERMPEWHTVSWNAMIVAYFHNEDLEEARSMFEKMPRQDMVSWTTMVVAYAQNGQLRDAKSTFDRMPQRDVVSWNGLMQAYAQNGHLEQARCIFDRMAQCDVISCTTMIIACAQAGLLEEARSTFDKMPQRNAVSWNAMIAGYSQNGHLEDSRSMFEDMPRRDIASWTAILQANAQNGRFMEVKNIFEAMPWWDVVSANAMLAAYAQKGYTQDVNTMFGTMLHRDVVSWTVVIQACAQNGLYSDALHLFLLMNLDGIKPNEITFIGILTGCSHAGMLDEGRQHFTSMRENYGLTPLVDHYHCMIDLLGRAKELEAAEELIKSMPFLPDDVSWTTLLGACGIHGDVRRGACAAEKLQQVEASNAMSYVLLSNALVAANAAA